MWEVIHALYDEKQRERDCSTWSLKLPPRLCGLAPQWCGSWTAAPGWEWLSPDLSQWSIHLHREILKGIKHSSSNYILISFTDLAEDLPGSKGHSFSLENSMGVLPVSTQLELRNIIGILKGKRNHIIMTVTSLLKSWFGLDRSW